MPNSLLLYYCIIYVIYRYIYANLVLSNIFLIKCVLFGTKFEDH